MSILIREKERALVSEQAETPPLVAGDYLTRAEFERRYHAQPELKKAELIEGIVYMPSPVRADKHGDPHFDLIGWLGFYRMMTPSVRGSDNATVRFDLLNEPQPDIILRLDPAAGGRSWIDGDGYLQGAPELVVEIAASSTSYDLHQKWATYARHGIQEYMVVQMNERIISWFALHEDTYVALVSNEEGILQSQIFPGLWFDTNGFWKDDMPAVLATLQRGMASSAYRNFTESLSVN
jgi:Uma2 family endonuclease